MEYLPCGPQDGVPAHTSAPYRASLLLFPPPTPQGSWDSADHPRAQGTTHWEAWVCGCTEGWPRCGKRWQVDCCSLSASLCWAGELKAKGTDGIRCVHMQCHNYSCLEWIWKEKILLEIWCMNDLCAFCSFVKSPGCMNGSCWLVFAHH